MFGDVGHPQPVGFGAGELTVDQIRSGGTRNDEPSTTSTPGKTRQTSPPHQHRHRIVTHGDPIPHGQLGVYPMRPIGASGGGVNPADHVGQPHVPDSPGRRWTTSLGVEPRLRDAQHPTGGLHRQALSDDHSDRIEPSFGDTT